MTKLHILETDLKIHTDRLAELKTPKKAAWFLKFRKIDVNLIIPSYVKIIKSIQDEIDSLKKPAAKKPAVKKTKTA